MNSVPHEMDSVTMVKLGKASPEVVDKHVRQAREWLSGKIPTRLAPQLQVRPEPVSNFFASLQSPEVESSRMLSNPRESLTTNIVVQPQGKVGSHGVSTNSIQAGVKPIQKPANNEVQVLSNGVAITSALIDFNADFPSIRNDYVKKQDWLNIFNTIITKELNKNLDHIISNGWVQIGSPGQKYNKLEGKDEDITRYLNTGQLVLPTIQAINNNVPVLGMGKEFYETKTFEVKKGSVKADFITGIISSVITGLSSNVISKLLGIATNASNEISAAVSNIEAHAIYHLIVPLYFFDEVSKLVQCAFTVIKCQMGQKATKLAVMCSSASKEALEVTLSVNTFNVNFTTLGKIVDNDQIAINHGQAWLRRNMEKKKVGELEEPNARVRSAPSNAE